MPGVLESPTRKAMIRQYRLILPFLGLALLAGCSHGSNVQQASESGAKVSECTPEELAGVCVRTRGYVRMEVRKSGS